MMRAFSIGGQYDGEIRFCNSALAATAEANRKAAAETERKAKLKAEAEKKSKAKTDPKSKALETAKPEPIARVVNFAVIDSVQ